MYVLQYHTHFSRFVKQIAKLPQIEWQIRHTHTERERKKATILSGAIR